MKYLKTHFTQILIGTLAALILFVVIKAVVSFRMQTVYTYLDTHPIIAWLVLFGAAFILLVILKLLDKDRTDTIEHKDRYYSRKN